MPSGLYGFLVEGADRDREGESFQLLLYFMHFLFYMYRYTKARPVNTPFSKGILSRF